MRDNPFLTDGEISLLQDGLWKLPTHEIIKHAADKATAEALKWVVDDLKEKRDWLEKQTPHPNTQLGHRFKQSTLKIFNLLIKDYEAKLKEIVNEQPRTTRTQ